MSEEFGILYLVPTPIGNLGDITKRAIDILNEVDLIACEDTRRSGMLLKKLEIKKKLISYHNYNESKISDVLISKLKNGLSVAVISDAGSPGISDPAFRVVQKAIENNIDIVPLPGANSIIPALTGSGLPLDRFYFEGFLSPKKSGRVKKFEALKELENTLIFFESPHRIEKALKDAHQVFGDRQACMAREISKLHEEFVRGTISEIIEKISSKKVKGEIVLVIAGNRK